MRLHELEIDPRRMEDNGAMGMGIRHSGASARLAVSSNDTKAVSVDGVTRIVENRAADNVTIVDLCISPSIAPKAARSPLRLRLRNSLCNLGRHESPFRPGCGFPCTTNRGMRRNSQRIPLAW